MIKHIRESNLKLMNVLMQYIRNSQIEDSFFHDYIHNSIYHLAFMGQK